MAWTERLPGGRVRVREHTAGGVVTLGTYDSEAEADAVASGGATLRVLGDAWLDARELGGVRGIRQERSRWSTYIQSDPISAVPVGRLRRRHVTEWLDRLRAKGLAAQTMRNALNLLRAALQHCLDRELLEGNPARDVRLRRGEGARTDEGWTYLDPAEQAALLEAVPGEWRTAVAFALGTGLRQGEQWALRREDIRLDRGEVLVRFGAKGKPTKGGRVRRVPLFGLGLEAARAVSSSPRPAGGLAFPTREGHARQGLPKRWHDWVKAAGITRRVRWHDLRHTCGTSLVAGWWGRTWTLDEVRDFLGHSQVAVTERYAHAVEGTLRAAARQTGWIEPDPRGGSQLADLNSGPAVYEPKTFPRAFSGS